MGLTHVAGVNDTDCRPVGDDLLSLIGKRLAAKVRPQDSVAHVGDNEFVVLAEGLTEQSAQALAHDLLDTLGVDVQGAAGIALSPPSEATALLRSATDAMRDRQGDRTRAGSPVRPP